MTSCEPRPGMACLTPSSISLAVPTTAPHHHESPATRNRVRQKVPSTAVVPGDQPRAPGSFRRFCRSSPSFPWRDQNPQTVPRGGSRDRIAQTSPRSYGPTPSTRQGPLFRPEVRSQAVRRADLRPLPSPAVENGRMSRLHQRPMLHLPRHGREPTRKASSILSQSFSWQP